MNRRPLLIALLVAAFVLAAGGAVVDRTAQPGDQITVPGLGTRTLVSGDDVLVGLPGDDFRFRVPVTAPPPPPIEPPVTPPTPPQTGTPDVVVNAGGSIGIGIAQAGSGTPAKLKTILVRAGQYSGTITPLSNQRIIGEGDVRLRGGCNLRAGLKNVFVSGIKFSGDKSRAYGLDSVFDGPGPQNVTIQDSEFSGFGGGVRLQHAKNDARAPFAQYAVDIVLCRVRLVDMSSTGSHEGHGGFACNVNGLLLDECYIADAGAAGNIRDQWVHGWYSKEGNRRVIFRRCLVDNGESFALQARGSTWKWNDPDNGDPGPIIEDCVIYNACHGIAIDGRRAQVTGNVIGVRYFHKGVRNSGWYGIYASVGTLAQGGNIRFRAAGATNRPDGYKAPAWRNDKSSSDVWTWRGATKTVQVGAADIDAIGKTIDLSDLFQRVRNGEPVGKIVDEAQARVRVAA